VTEPARAPVPAAATLGAAFGASGVALGAFGAHALRARISPALLEVYRTGVLYQLLHAVALIGIAGIADRLRRPRLTTALIGVGVLIFSGSLYTLALTGVGAWGAVTPLGGASLIAGWVSLLIGLRRRRGS
jgi:uncharacterized membrane protein YgdD (TMEM256/DUF423 family)